MLPWLKNYLLAIFPDEKKMFSEKFVLPSDNYFTTTKGNLMTNSGCRFSSSFVLCCISPKNKWIMEVWLVLVEWYVRVWMIFKKKKMHLAKRMSFYMFPITTVDSFCVSGYISIDSCCKYTVPQHTGKRRSYLLTYHGS